jgi:hypothetical protein
MPNIPSMTGAGASGVVVAEAVTVALTVNTVVLFFGKVMVATPFGMGWLTILVVGLHDWLMNVPEAVAPLTTEVQPKLIEEAAVSFEVAALSLTVYVPVTVTV